MPRVFSYQRFSSPSQINNDSIRRQLQSANDWCVKHNYTLDPLCLQDLGVSAYKSLNLEKRLGYFISLINSGEIKSGDILLLESLDRLSRDTIRNALKILDSILEKEIIVVTLLDGKTYTKESLNDLPDLIFSLMVMHRGHSESLLKSERISDAWQQKRIDILDGKEILTKNVPRWLEYDPDGTEYKFKFTTFADVVRQIFKLSYVDNHGTYTIIRTLNASNYKPVENKFKTKSTRFNASYIRKILNNPALYGSLLTDKIPEIKNYYPALISHDEFIVNLSKMQHRKTNGSGRQGKTYTNILNKITFCNACGGSVYFYDSQHKDGKYLRCINAKAGTCSSASWKYEDIEQTVLTHLIELNISSIFESEESHDNYAEQISNIEILLNDKRNKISTAEANLLVVSVSVAERLSKTIG